MTPGKSGAAVVVGEAELAERSEAFR